MADIDALVAKYRPQGAAPPAAPAATSIDALVAQYAPKAPADGGMDKATGRLPRKIDPGVPNLRAGTTPEQRALGAARKPGIEGGVTAPNSAEPIRRALSEGSLGLWDTGEAAGFAAKSQLPRLAGKDPGYGPGQAFDAARKAQREEETSRAGTPSTVGGFIGGAAPMLMGGAEAAAGKVPGWIERAVRGAKIGAGMGAAAGVGSAPTAKDIPKGAVVGGTLGAAAGPAIESVSSALKLGTKAFNTMTNNRFGSAVRSAEDKLYTALKKDGVIGPTADRIITKWRRNGVEPSLLDLGGKHTQTLVRKAGGVPGKAQHVLREREQSVEENLAPEAIGQVHKMVNDGRSADEITKDLTKRRADVAAKKYPTQYKTPVDVSGIVPELADPELRSVLNEARKTAVINKEHDKVKDFDNLLGLARMAHSDPEQFADYLQRNPQKVQAGVLDSLQTAFSETGKRVQQKSPNRARGYFSLASDLGKTLDAVPELKDARATYRTYSDMIRGFETGAEALKSKDAGVTIKAFQAMNKGAKQTARIGMRQAIENELAGNSTATLAKLQSNKATRDILAAMFGEDEAARLARAAKYRLEQLSNASRAAGGAAKAERNHVGPFISSPVSAAKHGAISAAANAGKGLSPREAEALASLSKGGAAKTLRRIKPEPHKKVRKLAGEVRGSAAVMGYDAAKENQ